MTALEHTNDHAALFEALANIRNNFAAALLPNHTYSRLPAFEDANGTKHEIEPERSIIIPRYQMLGGIKQALENNIPGFKIIKNSECGFRYPTAAIAGRDLPLIKRFRSDLFEKHTDGHIYIPKNMSYGIKSSGKADNRLEYEVDIPAHNLTADPAQLFIDKYGDDLPTDILAFAKQDPVVHGWMGVKRAAFEAIYTNKALLGDISVHIALSVDAFNIGANPDLSFNPEVGSAIAVQNAELEWEGMGYFVPKTAAPSNAEIWHAMNTVIPLIGDAVEDLYSNIIIPSDESKTERILSTVFNNGATEKSIAALNLKPLEFLQTTSNHRTKAHNPAEYINFAKRLHDNFHDQAQALPRLTKMHHDMSAQPTKAQILMPA